MALDQEADVPGEHTEILRVDTTEDERIGFQQRCPQTGRDRCCRLRKEEQRHAKPLQRRNSETAVQQTSCLREVNPQGQKEREGEREESEREDENCNTLHHPEAD
ncbi:unnamed protein product [Leuciscus chuanchicus]